jgi:predicted metal-binding membrane protein
MIVALAALSVTLIAAWYTFAEAGLAMTASPAWTPGYALLNLAMWWVMMIAMMTPSAAPMLLLYTAVKRMGPDADRVALLSLMFLAGYLVAWGGFSLIATLAQWQIETLGLSMGAMMPIKSGALAGAVLLLAGLYQLTEVKNACLSHCRSPGAFLVQHRHPGAIGALRLGVIHGWYCLGCCWALMALLFVGGIMNIYWIVGLALYVLAEKHVPKVHVLSRLTGGILIVAGTYALFTALA